MSISIDAYICFVAIRDFPKAIATAELEQILSLCLHGLRNCINLRAFHWTRDGSLSTSILQTLNSLPSLCELEINGHSDGYYDPTTLLQFTRLRKITLILPGSKIVNLLPAWTACMAGTLRHLTLIFEASDSYSFLTQESSEANRLYSIPSSLTIDC